MISTFSDINSICSFIYLNNGQDFVSYVILALKILMNYLCICIMVMNQPINWFVNCKSWNLWTSLNVSLNIKYQNGPYEWSQPEITWVYHYKEINETLGRKGTPNNSIIINIFKFFFFFLTLCRCDRLFHNKKLFDSHQAKHKLGNTYSCTICSKKYDLKVLLLRHMDTFHFRKAPIFRCVICDHTFNTRISLTQHMRTHKKDQINVYYCSSCGFLSDVRKMLEVRFYN